MIRHKFLAYAAAILFIIIGLKFSFTTVAAVTPICGACHETRSEYDAWKKSRHAKVSCFTCHGQSGIAGYISGPVQAFRVIGVKLSGNRSPATVNINDDICLKCHDTILDDVVTKNGVKVKHRQIVDDGRRCRNCHAGIGHSVTGELSYNDFASMDKCLGCHNTKKLRKCSLCHTKTTGSGLADQQKMGFLAHDSTWNRRHRVADSRFCRVCHNQDFCGQCHRTQVPHPSTWPEIHGEAAVTTSRCLSCHRQNFCDNCHLLKLPHATDFDHGATARKRRSVCDRCHTEANCKECHDIHDQHQPKQP